MMPARKTAKQDKIKSQRSNTIENNNGNRLTIKKLQHAYLEQQVHRYLELPQQCSYGARNRRDYTIDNQFITPIYR